MQSNARCVQAAYEKQKYDDAKKVLSQLKVGGTQWDHGSREDVHAFVQIRAGARVLTLL